MDTNKQMFFFPGDKRQIIGVTTQGRASRPYQWVTSYTIAHGNDSSQFQMYRESTEQDKVIWRASDDAPNLGYVNERQQESFGSCDNPKVLHVEAEQPL